MNKELDLGHRTKRSRKMAATRKKDRRDSLIGAQYDRGRVVSGLARPMINSLQINGYRGFLNFEMSGLGWVNLLVGKNNSGKTSVLEALSLLASGADPIALWEIVSRRGERLDADTVRQETELDISHLFHGHELKPGARFTLSARNSSPIRSYSFAVQEVLTSSDETQEMFPPEPNEPSLLRLMISSQSKAKTPVPATILSLSRRGGLRSEYLETPRNRLRRPIERSRPAQFISTESISGDDLVAMWNDVVLTDSEEMVLTALRFLEPGIERIAAITTPNRYYGRVARGGFKIKLRNTLQPVPIGSMGDGIWRMLAMAIALIRAKGGVLLVDEIDTGLHHTVMTDMWKLIYNTAQAFNVQVFATTHSYDCIQSLASICHSSVGGKSPITIQRIEIGRSKAVQFTESEIKIAAERNIEIR